MASCGAPGCLNTDRGRCYNSGHAYQSKGKQAMTTPSPDPRVDAYDGIIKEVTGKMMAASAEMLRLSEKLWIWHAGKGTDNAAALDVLEHAERLRGHLTDICGVVADHTLTPGGAPDAC
jgi:hypothetical protein